MDDVRVTTKRGSGKGGQKRNKTESCVQVKHIPSGIIVCIDNERNQHQNKEEALTILTERVNKIKLKQASDKHNLSRKIQMGGGHRSDKIRTYNFINSRVIDHRLNKRTDKIKQVLKGRFDLLFK